MLSKNQEPLKIGHVSHGLPSLYRFEVKWSESHSVVSDSLQSHGLYSPWNSPGQNTGGGSLSFLQGIFPTQGLNPGLLHCRQILYQLSHQWSLPPVKRNVLSPVRTLFPPRLLNLQPQPAPTTHSSQGKLKNYEILFQVHLKSSTINFQDNHIISVPSGMCWKRQWHPTPVLLPGKSHRQRSLVGCSPWGSLRVGHDWASSLSLFTFLHWRRKWQPTPVFLPGESQG